MAFRKSTGGGNKATAIIMTVVGTVITLWVGGQVLTTSASAMTANYSGPFNSSLGFLGMTSATGTWSWTTTGIVSIMGLIAIAAMVLAYLRRSKL